MAGLQYLGVIVDVGNPANQLQNPRTGSEPPAMRSDGQSPSSRDANLPRASGFSTTSRRASAATRAARSATCAPASPAERAFVEKHAGSLMALDDLKTIRERIEARLHWEYGKKTGTLLDEDEPAPHAGLQRHRAQVRRPAGGRRPGGEPLLQPAAGADADADRGGRLLDQRRAGGGAHPQGRGGHARAGRPGAYAPGMRVGLTGDVAISAEEMAALVQDLTLSSALVVVAVLLAIVLFYGWRRSIPALFLPLVAGGGLRVRRGQPAAVRDHRAQLEHGVPRLDHHRQRDQLRHHPAGPLPGGAADRPDGRGGAGDRDLGDALGDAVGGAGGRRRLRVAGRHAVPRLPAVRRDRRPGDGVRLGARPCC